MQMYLTQLELAQLNQGCGAGTQISGSGSGPRHLHFLTPDPQSRRFWLRLQNDLVH